MKIAILGAGSWGTALAATVSQNNEVSLWARRKGLCDEINRTRKNKTYLDGITLPSNFFAKNSIKDTVEGSQIIISVIPSEYLRNVMQSLKPFVSNQIIISATKGIEHSSGKRMSQVIEDELGKRVKVAALSGPNHAEEVARKMPTASVIACRDKKTALACSKAISTDSFKVYPLDDIAGVETCGALKNITAIATGVCDGFGFGDNARASIIKLGLMEMNNFGRHFGVKRGTVYGLAGVGDLIATCVSKHSRNRFVGEQLAKGKTMKEIKSEMHGMIAEGIPTTKAVYEYSVNHRIQMPLTHQAYEVLFNNKDIKKAIVDLLNLV